MRHKVACIQMTSGENITSNLAAAKLLIAEAAAEGAALVVLPEMFALMGLDQMDKIKHREEFGQGPIQDFLSTQAILHNTWIIGGTIPLVALEADTKARAACLMFDAKGKCVSRYDKIHLFDVCIRPGQEIYAESQTIEPGNEVVVVSTPVGRIGLAVCYDVRFPELFRQMHEKQVEIIVLPAAFTYATGAQHWDVLLKARAIENLSYVIAACQTGIHTNTRKTYGHSMIVNPWGNVLACLPDEPGILLGELDLESLYQIRRDFPALSHRRY